MQPKYNYSLLRFLIRVRCGSYKAFATILSIPEAKLIDKLYNVADWSCDEIERAVKLLRLNGSETQACFFCISKVSGRANGTGNSSEHTFNDIAKSADCQHGNEFLEDLKLELTEVR